MSCIECSSQCVAHDDSLIFNVHTSDPAPLPGLATIGPLLTASRNRRSGIAQGPILVTYSLPMFKSM